MLRLVDAAGERRELLGTASRDEWPAPSWRARGLWLKHSVDTVCAALALVVISPLLLAIAIAVKLTSPGPVFFRQERIGLHGKPFQMLKFRSMRSAAVVAEFEPADGVAPGGLEGEDRRTRLGRWLRASSLDELPQLFNVVLQQMSLIGPRPERPQYVERFCDEVPGYSRRLRMRPGMTGLAQVRGLRGATSLPRRVEADNQYIDSWSLWLDVKVLLLTVRTVLDCLRRSPEDEPPTIELALVGRALPARAAAGRGGASDTIRTFPVALAVEQDREKSPRAVAPLIQVAAELAPPRRVDDNIVPLPTAAHVAGLLTIVIVAHNGRELLRSCLDSLSADEWTGSCEVIVVDNASTDGAVAMVRHDHPWVRVIESGGNVGFARAANIGIRASSGEYILLLNPDTVVPPGALRGCVEELRRRPSIGMLGCKLVRLDGSLDHACKRSFPTPMSALAHMSRLSRLPVASSRFSAYTAAHIDDDDVALVDAVNGAFMLIRAAALEQVGLLDESYWMYGEDLDLCFRFWAARWPVLYWPHQSVVHVKGGIAGRHRAWHTNLAFHRAMWIFFARHQAATYPWAVRSAVWAAIWLKLCVSATRSACARSAQRLRKLR